MSIEEELKAAILSAHGSLREFAVSIDMPYSTLDSIFKRGLENASIRSIVKICDALEISADALAEGKIVPRRPIENASGESELVRLYRSMNDEGRNHLLSTARLIAGNPAMKKEQSRNKAIS